MNNPHQSADTCPICKAKAKPLDKTGNADGFECVNDGRFRVASSVLATETLVAKPRHDWEAALAKAKKREPTEWAPTIKTYDFE